MESVRLQGAPTARRKASKGKLKIGAISTPLENSTLGAGISLDPIKLHQVQSRILPSSLPFPGEPSVTTRPQSDLRSSTHSFVPTHPFATATPPPPRSFALHRAGTIPPRSPRSPGHLRSMSTPTKVEFGVALASPARPILHIRTQTGNEGQEIRFSPVDSRRRREHSELPWSGSELGSERDDSLDHHAPSSVLSSSAMASEVSTNEAPSTAPTTIAWSSPHDNYSTPPQSFEPTHLRADSAKETLRAMMSQGQAPLPPPAHAPPPIPSAANLPNVASTSFLRPTQRSERAGAASAWWQTPASALKLDKPEDTAHESVTSQLRHSEWDTDDEVERRMEKKQRADRQKRERKESSRKRPKEAVIHASTVELSLPAIGPMLEQGPRFSVSTVMHDVATAADRVEREYRHDEREDEQRDPESEPVLKPKRSTLGREVHRLLTAKSSEKKHKGLRGIFKRRKAVEDEGDTEVPIEDVLAEDPDDVLGRARNRLRKRRPPPLETTWANQARGTRSPPTSAPPGTTAIRPDIIRVPSFGPDFSHIAQVFEIGRAHV